MPNVTIREFVERRIEAGTTAERQKLVKAIEEARSSDFVLDLVYALAAEEERQRLWTHLQIALKFCGDRGVADEVTLADVLDEVTREIVSRGADDGWSGRRNDLRRVVFDAKRDWVERTSRQFLR